MQQPQIWNAFAAYVRQQTGLVHENLARWMELVEVDSFRFLVIDDLRGESLQEQLFKNTTLPPIETIKTIFQAARGVAAMHQAGYVHGDLRPENLWIESGGRTKVLRPANARQPGPLNFAIPDATGQTAAKADYLAPEFLQPGKSPDQITDVYALGCSFFQLLTGSVPFPDGDPIQKLHRHATEPIRSPEMLEVPPPVVQVVSYMMAKNPAIRIPNAMKSRSNWARCSAVRLRFNCSGNTGVIGSVRTIFATAVPQCKFTSRESRRQFELDEQQPRRSSTTRTFRQTVVGSIGPAPGPVLQTVASIGAGQAEKRLSLRRPQSNQCSSSDAGRPIALRKKNQLPLFLGIGGTVVALIVAVAVIMNLNSAPNDDGREN